MYEASADAWSFGVIIYLLLTRKFPFFADDELSESESDISFDSEAEKVYQETVLEQIEYKILNEEPNLGLISSCGHSM